MSAKIRPNALTAATLSIAALLAMSAQTQAEQTTVNVTGVVDDGCTVDTNFHQTTADLGKLVDGSGRLTDRTTTVSLGTASCNAGAAKLSIESAGKGLKRQGTPPSTLPDGFTDFVAYTAKADWGTLHPQFVANGGLTAQDSAQSASSLSSELTVTVSTQQDHNVQPLEGGYADTLTVKVGFLL